MGLKSVFDSLLGRGSLPEAKTDRLFAISTAVVTLEVNLRLEPSSSAGICFKPMEMSKYKAAREEIEGLLKYSTQETGTEFSLEKDEYNFLWVILKDPDFEDLVTNIHMVSQTLIENDFGEQLLCAVYRFEGKGTVSVCVFPVSIAEREGHQGHGELRC